MHTDQFFLKYANERGTKVELSVELVGSGTKVGTRQRREEEDVM